MSTGISKRLKQLLGPAGVAPALLGVWAALLLQFGAATEVLANHQSALISPNVTLADIIIGTVAGGLFVAAIVVFFLVAVGRLQGPRSPGR